VGPKAKVGRALARELRASPRPVSSKLLDPD